MNRDQIWDEAQSWVARKHADNFSSSDEREFQRWHARSPLHAKDYERALRIWQDIGLFCPPSQRTRRRTLPYAAASVAACILLSFLFLSSRHSTAPEVSTEIQPAIQEYNTPRGGMQTITLGDGSTIHMSCLTRLSVQYTKDERRIVLHEGEAFFKVTHDAARPFSVYAIDGKTQVLGTEFEVKSTANVTRVTDLSGKVAVCYPANAAPFVTLTKGLTVSYGPNGAKSEVTQCDVESVASWRRGVLYFNDDSLSEIAADLNRYTTRTILIDESLGGQTFSGVCNLSHINDFIQGVTKALGLKASIDAQGAVTIKR